MTSNPVRLYNRLPSFVRSFAATARGYYLRAWRFGPETEKLVAEALTRETWSAAQWEAYRQQQLAVLLRRAATRVPYYRDHWAERRRKGDHASWEVLENWPLLEKEQVRAAPQAFVADDVDLRHLYHYHTSGT